MARVLSPKQARIIHVLLARRVGPEEGWMRRLGLVRSTFGVIRRQAFHDGWLIERYVPEPAPLGIRRVVFEVGRPYAESRDEALGAWQTRRGTVLLWRFRDTLVSVRWEEKVSQGGPTPSDPAPSEAKLFHKVWTVGVGAGAGGVPIYFDFEGAWARWSGSGPPISYPIGMGGLSSGDPEIEPPRLSPRDRRAALELVRRGPPREAALQRGGGAAPPVEAWRPAPRAPTWIQRRVFPDMSRMPPMRDRRLEQMIFVTGLLRKTPNAPSRSLMEGLFREAAIAPFLVAYDADRFLMGLLSPRPPSAGEHPVPVMQVLEERLHSVEIERDVLSTLVPIVDHRYDDLVAESATGGASTGDAGTQGPPMSISPTPTT